MTVQHRAVAITAAIIAVSAAVTSAHAQPSNDAHVVPPPLTRREQALLERGPISGTRHVAGVAISVLPGLGLGHIVQGRWKERGWIFTLGEFVAFGFIAVAASESDLDANVVGALAITGWGGLIGLRVWEVKDAVSGPKRHNRRLRELRARRRLASQLALEDLQFYVAPRGEPRGGGVVAGVALHF